jgi:hypothetical protein
MSAPGDKARRLHDEASIMHLDTGDELRGVLARVRVRALSLASQQPHLVGEDPRILYSRLVTPTTLVTGEVALQRAAIAMLLVAAVERAENLRIDSGNDAA